MAHLAIVNFLEINFSKLAFDYRIAGSFQGRKLSRFGGNMDCSLVLLLNDAMSPNFVEKKFANSYKTSKFAKVFSLESFSLYSMKF